MITGFQLRAAKAVLGLTAQEIAQPIGVNPATINRLCTTDNFDYLSCSAKNLISLKNFFESIDIVFVGEHGLSMRSTSNENFNLRGLTRFQLKVARIALQLTQEELSRQMKISSSMISILENFDNHKHVYALKVDVYRLKRFFEHLGITFPYDLTVILLKDPKIIMQKSINMN